jgi:uncharacterized protein YjbI with pentapeptide repeats
VALVLPVVYDNSSLDIEQTMLQDFRHHNLAGCSFKGQDLTGASFQGANIRGTNFSYANLTGTDLTQVDAGLQRQWWFALILFSLFLAGIAGFVTAYAFGISIDIGLNKSAASCFLALLAIGVVLLINSRQGLVATGAIAVGLAAVAALLGALAPKEYAGIAIIQGVAIAGTISGSMIGALATAITSHLMGRVIRILLGCLMLIGALIGSFRAITSVDEATQFISVVVFILTISLLVLRHSLHAGWLAQSGQKKYDLIRVLAMYITLRGTSFKGANLTDANFTQATLSNTDFRQATLTRTNWFKAQGLGHACTEGTYLEREPIRHLAIFKQGKSANFDYEDLRGINLQDADLEDASFTGADLSSSSLSGANLIKAKLVHTQLYNSDLSKACLTGAYLEGWGISVDTNLEGVQCEYAYMHLPTSEDPDPCRKPDNKDEIFLPGEFADFMTPIQTTLDLYRRQYVDPREVATSFKTLDLSLRGNVNLTAAAIALQSVVQKHPEARLEVRALEGRGQDKIRLQTQVDRHVNRSQLSAQYAAHYEALKAMPPDELQALVAGMAEKDDRIRSLEHIVMTAVQQERNFYIETQLGDIVTEKHSTEIHSESGDVINVRDIHAHDSVINLGQISGDVSQQINQLSEDTNPDQARLKELLIQLQQLIEAQPGLTPEDKTEGLEQVKILAKAAQEPNDGPFKKSAKTAVKILRGTAAGIPTATQFFSNLSGLLTEISTLLCLV